MEYVNKKVRKKAGKELGAHLEYCWIDITRVEKEKKESREQRTENSQSRWLSLYSLFIL